MAAFNVMAPVPVLKLAAAIVPVMVCVPDAVRLIAFNAPFVPAPILPTKVMPAVPALMVSERAVASALLMVDAASAKLTKAFVVVNVVSAPSNTALL